MSRLESLCHKVLESIKGVRNKNKEPIDAAAKFKNFKRRTAKEFQWKIIYQLLNVE